MAAHRRATLSLSVCGTQKGNPVTRRIQSRESGPPSPSRPGPRLAGARDWQLRAQRGDLSGPAWLSETTLRAWGRIYLFSPAQTRGMAARQSGLAAADSLTSSSLSVLLVLLSHGPVPVPGRALASN